MAKSPIEVPSSCANGCKKPPKAPSKVICEDCQERITAVLERWARNGIGQEDIEDNHG